MTLKITLDLDNPEHLRMFMRVSAEIICNREFGASRDRWDRTLQLAKEGGSYSLATVERLHSTAAAVLQGLVNAAAEIEARE